jgi:hypothetical protein
MFNIEIEIITTVLCNLMCYIKKDNSEIHILSALYNISVVVRLSRVLAKKTGDPGLILGTIF